VPTLEYDISEDDDDVKELGIDVPSFCEATHIMYLEASEKNSITEDCIAFLKPAIFNPIKYIMVSATVNETICRNYFGPENVDFYECRLAKYEGTLTQFYNKSMSRSDIDKNPGILEFLQARSGYEFCITFQKYHKGSLYFGNTEGCNYMAGKNIDVIGTPYQIDFIYKLFAFSIGLQFDEDAKMKPNLSIIRNGYIFPFTTYEDEVLRDIHLWLIESELEQAVGRGRLLRNPNNVNLFSNYPLRQSIMREFDYEGIF
jgi:hypothetical protein